MTTTPHEAQSADPRHRPPNLAEYFLLLDLDERGGRLLLDGSTSGLALAGAVLADLAGRGHLTVTQDEVLVRTSSGPAVEGLERPLAQVLGIITEHGQDHEPRDAEQWINRFSRPELREALLQSLESQGIIEHTEGKVLGLFRRERYPETDPNPELDLRARIGEVLYGSAPADPVTWPLIALLRSTRLLHVVFPDRHTTDLRAVSTTPVGESSTRDSVAEVLQATENAIAESLVATTGGASALD